MEEFKHMRNRIELPKAKEHQCQTLMLECIASYLENGNKSYIIKFENAITNSSHHALNCYSLVARNFGEYGNPMRLKIGFVLR